MAALSCLCFVTYAWMVAPGVEWMDAGELAAAAFALGGAHPPGHPLHSMLGKMATLLPIGEVAFRINLMSALGMAAAVTAVAALVRQLVASSLAAALAALLVALSPLARANATRAEVYGVVAALVLWATVAAARFVSTDRAHRQMRDVLLAALGWGLAAAVHPVIAMAAAVPMITAVILAAPRRVGRLAPLAVGLGLLGLTCYAYGPLRAGAVAPPLWVWGTPITVERFVDLITAPAYRDNFSIEGLGRRLLGLLPLASAGSGLAAGLAGLLGLGWALARRSPAAAMLSAGVVTTLVGAASQRAFNPDMPGYLVPAVAYAAVGSGVLIAAIAQHAPRLPWAGWAAGAAIAALAGAAPGAAGLDVGARRHDDALRHWDTTVGTMPAGPAIYFANSDHSLFPAQYERLVAQARPDVALANRELVRDIWFLEHLKRALPELYVPFVDDDARDRPASRLAGINMQQGRPVGGDEPAFDQLRASHAGPRGRAFAYALSPIAARYPIRAVPEPPAYQGAIGARVARRVALVRAEYEAGRGRLAHSARAAGLAGQLAGDWPGLAAPTARPNLYARLPALSRVFIAEPWQVDALADDLRWRARLPGAPVPPSAPAERRLLAAWHDLFTDRPAADAAMAAIAGLGRDAELATAQVLLELDRPELAERQLRVRLDRDRQDTAALLLLGSLVSKRQNLAEAERLFAAAAATDPQNAEAFARLGAVQARQGKLAAARASWQRALVVAPHRQDVAAWLRSLRDNEK
jgi:tetratricopeptide (TPR) repeat protein